MISTDFAPNESWDDAWLSIKLLFQPWKWQRGVEIEVAKKQILKTLISSSHHIGDGRSDLVQLFLTGRSALNNVLKSLDLPKNSEVIIQAFTCEAVVLPVIANELKPVYIDIESETYSMDLDDLKRKLTKNSKVLILQHTFELTPKFRKEILMLAQKNNLVVIEDIAHGFQKAIFSSNPYTLNLKTYFLMSFGRSKSISSVFGGAIISSSNETLEQSNNLSYPSYWFIFKCLLYKPLVMFIKSTYDFYIGKLIHKITNLLGLLIPEITTKEKEGKYDTLLEKAYPNGLAILLIHQLNKFERIQKNRVKICAVYIGKLSDLSSRTRFEISKQMLNQVQHDMVILIRFPLLVNDRDAVISEMKKQNIFLGKWYDQVVAPKDLDLKRVGYRMGSCPIAEEICQKIINFPTNISEVEAKKVVKIFNDVTFILSYINIMK